MRTGTSAFLMARPEVARYKGEDMPGWSLPDHVGSNLRVFPSLLKRLARRSGGPWREHKKRLRNAA